MNRHETFEYNEIDYLAEIENAGGMPEEQADIECERLYQKYKVHKIKKGTIEKQIKEARRRQEKARQEQQRKAAAQAVRERLKLLGEDTRTIDQLLSQCKIDDLLPEQCIAAMNRTHAFVLEGGRATVLRRSFDPEMNRDVYQRLSDKDFCIAYQNVNIIVGYTENNKPITQPLGDLWMYSELRRQFLDGIVFDPSGNAREGCLNLWTGFAVEAKKGSWKRMRRHIWKILCKKDKACFRYLMCWLARMFQHPELLAYACVVLRGKKGAGKGVFAEAIMRILGPFALHIREAKHLVGHFNRHLQTIVFLFADEAFFAGDKAHESVLKGLITEQRLEIEAKFRDLVEAINRLHPLLASNEDWVVPAGMDERRFLVLDVSDEVANNHDYFAPLRREMEQEGGDAAMLYDLLRLDISNFNPADIPETEGLLGQKKLTMGLEWKWWNDVLERGYVLESEHGCDEKLHCWFERVTTNALYASYEAFVDKQRRSYPNKLSREAFGKFLHQGGKDGLGLQPRKAADALDGERRGSSLESFKGIVMLNERRKPGYELGTLAQARERFSEATHFEVSSEEEIGTEIEDIDRMETRQEPAWGDAATWTAMMSEDDPIPF